MKRRAVKLLIDEAITVLQQRGHEFTEDDVDALVKVCNAHGLPVAAADFYGEADDGKGDGE